LVAEQRAQVERRVAEDNYRARQEKIRAEQTLLVEAIPAWKDEAVMKAEKAEMLKFAESLNYTADDLNGIDDHRALVLIRDAMKYRQSQAKKETLIKQVEKVRTTRPGNATMTRTPPNALQRSLERLAKSGSREDAQAVFFNSLED
jgi:hypothetical protein